MWQNTNVTKCKCDKMQQWQNAKIPYVNNPKYKKNSILGVPIENKCVKGGVLLYGGFGLLIFGIFAFCLFLTFCHICILSNLHFVWIPIAALTCIDNTYPQSISVIATLGSSWLSQLASAYHLGPFVAL